MFTANTICPGVTHITDAMGVSFTLIEGNDRAVLFDTGYGTEDVAAYVKTLTNKPVTVLLSHGHHDHMLGARWFEKTFICEEDMEEFRMRSGELQRRKVIKQAKDRGVYVPDDFMTAPVRLPDPLRFNGSVGLFDSREEDLGRLCVNVIHVPGHTPGSIVLHVPARSLLLTGDDWNPCTWMWFPSSLPADKWREYMLELVGTLEKAYGEISNVLCSHQPKAREGREVKEYLDFMTPELMKEAPAVDMGAPIETYQIVRGEWALVFDRAKLFKG